MKTRALSRTNDVMLPSLFEDFIRPWNDWFDGGSYLGRTMYVPSVNIEESKDEYKLSMAVPGMKKSDFKIDVTGNVLTISSEKEENKEEKEENYSRMEYNYSSFSRSFTLPDEVNKDKIDANYVDGVLKLVLPKKEEAKKLTVNKKIAVK
ncbi:MAG TPA: Hsp20/alpha crystallin family protein [Hanamia sp.]|nr:Hsp20/alpha crystallin family protein [Hanamia sp.]